MLLGDKRYFSRENFENNKGLSLNHLSELVVYCLELVSQLSYYKLDFRFKGGNSLLILLEDPKRFSIDVDIVTTESKEQIIEIVEKIISEAGIFSRFESRSPQTKPWLPMISFKLFFNSVYQAPEDSYVMLDVVLQAPPYEGIKKQVKCLDIYNSEQIVEVPSISGLIGDKLLTIGPSTLGIPLNRGKEGHRLKHIFDIALLSRKGFDLNSVKNSVDGCMDQENEIQQSNFYFDEIIEDTILFLEAPLDYKKLPKLEELNTGSYIYEIAKGFDEFKEHVFGLEYDWKLFRKDCKAILDIVKKIRH